MRKAHSLLISLLFFHSSLQAADRDISGSKDHELISRYESSVIVGYQYRDHDIFRLPLSGLKRARDGIVIEDYLDLEGRLTFITYELNVSTSTLKVMKNFSSALSDAGFAELFQCSGRECGVSDIWDEALDHVQINNGKQATIRYMAVNKSEGQKGIYVGVYVMETYGGKVYVALNVLESSEMETGLVKVNAKTLERELSKNGKVAVYGIYFDTNKADLKQESTTTLDEIHALLTTKKNLNLYIVGHTDDTGDLRHNLNLSKRRAEAVTQVLVTKYGISADRLTAFGAGPYAPVASNLEQNGQAKNRRVELVQRID